MGLNQIISRYKQFGGLRLVLEYAKHGVLWPALKVGSKCVVKRNSFKAIYPVVLKRVEPKLIAKYGSRVQEFKDSRKSSLEHKHPKVIWWCWLQGKEQAPPIVQACFTSLHRNLVQEFNGSSEGYEIKVIDAENWKEYVELPDYIVGRWNKKQIPPALFTDLLRLQLLIKYGGAWIDSTVLCTGFNGLSGQEFKNYLDADLFVFQYTRPGEKWSGNISNWFITAHSNNEVLIVLRDMLFAYWKDYNCTLDYYIFHLFFKLVAEKYPDQIAAMPYGYSTKSLALLHHWGEKFNQEKWDRLTSKVCFHKLAFRVNESVKRNKENYFNYILSRYGRI